MSTNQDLELAISRIVDRRESDDDWRRIEAAQAETGEALADLVETLKADATLRSYMRSESDAVANHDLPALPHPEMPRPRRKFEPRRIVHAASLVAAVLIGLWVGRLDLEDPVQTTPAKTKPVISSHDALATYVSISRAEGRHLSFLEDVIVGVSPREGDSRLVVTTIKRMVEQHLIDGVMETKADDSGRLVAMPVTPDRLQDPQTF